MMSCGDGRGAQKRPVSWGDASTFAQGKRKLLARRILTATLTCSLLTAQVPATVWADALESAAPVVAVASDASAQGAASVADASAGASGQVNEGAEAVGADSSDEASSTSTQPEATSGAAAATQDAASGAVASGVQAAGTTDGTNNTGAAGTAAQATQVEAASSEVDTAAGADAGAKVSSEPAIATQAADAARAAETVSVSSSIIGIDAQGAASLWAPAATYEMEQGDTAADVLERAIADAGLVATVSGEGESWYLSDITAPYDSSVTLGWDEATGRYWQLFVNGKAAEFGAGQIELSEGDSVVLCYSAYGDELPQIGESDTDEATVSASVGVIGPDAKGTWMSWAPTATYELPAGSTAADLTERVLADAGLAADYGEGEWGWYLNSITSPVTGEVLGYNAETGAYWQLYVNGESASLGAGQIELAAGDQVMWAYTAYGEALPTPGEDSGETPSAGDLEIVPDAPRPDYEATWSGFGNSGSQALTDVATPVEGAEQKWAVDLKAEGEQYVSAGDPIIVNGDIYVTTSTELVRIDGETGQILARVSTGGSTSYFSRPVYSGGVIIVPSDDGSLAAFTAEELVCVWKTPALDAPANGGSYQANSTLTVSGGCVIAGFESGAGANGTATAGALVCVRISDGEVQWVRTTVAGEDNPGEGYYWAGAATSGDDIIIGDEGGRIQLIDTESGEVLSTVEIGMACRSTIVPAGTDDAGNQVYLAVGRGPATLFRIVRTGDALEITGQVTFAATSTSTPAVSDGVAYVGGVDADYHGVLAAIDLATMTVKDSYTAQTGEVKSAPLVSVQGGETYVYFTSNATPGGVYLYRASTGEVTQLFTPDAAQQNYCTASVIADADGTLYYTNDSGYLFALRAASGATSPETPSVPEGSGDQAGQTPSGPNIQPGDGTLSDQVSGGTGTANRPAARRPVASTVAPSSRPLSAALTESDVQAAETKSAAPEDANADAVEGEASLSASAAMESTTGEKSDEDTLDGDAADGQVNPWAVGGVVAGVIGIAIIGVYLAINRNRGAQGGR